MANRDPDQRSLFLPKKRSTFSAGFTLVELLIAMAVLAIMLVMAFGGLKVLLNTQEEVARRNRELGQLQMLVNQIKTDLEQAANRPARDAEGTDHPPMVGQPAVEDPPSALDKNTDIPFLSLTRTGRDNPLHVHRSALQRVAYAFKKKQLVRLSWEMLDQTPNTLPVRDVMLDNLQGVDVRYLDNDLAWHTRWPEGGRTGVSGLPRAVEIVLEVRGLGRVRQLVRVMD
ncbi:MAG: type II secretion system minor pseudopilin GspJ [Magnetococcales bacterium]|nr:type II secretion system minor pseudopilin GspJ [Magnetococcales bacterium]